MKIPKGFKKGAPTKPGWYLVIQGIYEEIDKIEGAALKADEHVELGYVGYRTKDVYVVYTELGKEEKLSFDKVLGGVHCHKKVKELERYYYK